MGIFRWWASKQEQVWMPPVLLRVPWARCGSCFCISWQKSTARNCACEQQKPWSPLRSLRLRDDLASQIWKPASRNLFFLPCPHSSGEQWDKSWRGFPGFSATFSCSPGKCRSESLIWKTRGDPRSVAAAIDCRWGELQLHPVSQHSLPLQGCVFWLQYKLKALSLPQASYGTRELLHWKATSPSAPTFSSDLARDKLFAEVWLWVERGKETLDN